MQGFLFFATEPAAEESGDEVNEAPASEQPPSQSLPEPSTRDHAAGWWADDDREDRDRSAEHNGEQ
jgi:hypothetical protein